MTVIVTELLLVLSILPSRGTPRQAPASPPLVQASAHISPSCPKAHRRAAAPILWAFGHKGFNQLNRADLSKLAQRDLRSLKQASACARLDQFYAGSTYDSGAWKREYFEAGAYYIASIYYLGSSKTDVQRGHMAIFTSGFQLIGVVPNSP